jgi:hypothetical protein
MKGLALGIGAIEAALWGWLVVAQAGTSGVWLVMVFLGINVGVGTLLAFRVPGNPIGWLLLLVNGLFFAQLPVGLLGEALVDSRPGVAAWLLWYGSEREDTWTWFPPLWLLFTQVILLFPDGRLPSRAWRPFWWFTIAVLVYGTAVLSMLDTEVAPGIPSPAGVFDNESPAVAAALLGLLVSVLGSGWSLVRRYRGASLVIREQIRWVVLAGVVVLAGYGLTLILVSVGVESNWSWVALSYSLIPLSIAVAVLRYRLYDIDRILSRTVSYVLVTFVVVGTYALVVTSVSRLLPGSGALPVAGATLAAAAVCLPVLRRVRVAVDRRFDRARFDAQVEVDGFAERMGSAVDVEDVAADLTETAHRLLSPDAVGLWHGGPR